MNQEDRKRRAAAAAINFVPHDVVIGVGTGSTANYFIDELTRIKGRLEGVVASSMATAERLRARGIDILELNDAGPLALYVDGADEATAARQLIKGGGGALTREKVLAAASRRFVCIIDDSKLVACLGRFPLPVEVIPMARSFVTRELQALGGQPDYRAGFITDNGNLILDVYHLDMTDPRQLEQTINQIPGVVTNGLFAHRTADVLLVGAADGVRSIQ